MFTVGGVAFEVDGAVGAVDGEGAERILWELRYPLGTADSTVSGGVRWTAV
jgi:hypothetical protein